MKQTFKSLLRSTGFIALFATAVYLGRLTVVPGTQMSLVWPAAGVAVLWFLLASDRRTFAVDIAAFSVATIVINSLTGATPALAFAFLVANFAQIAVFLVVFRKLCPRIWSKEDKREFAELADLWKLGVAAVAAAAVGALIGPTAVWVASDHWTPLSAFVWMIRNATSIVLIGGVGLRLRGSHISIGAECKKFFGSRARNLETAAALSLSVAAYGVIFGIGHGLPVAFFGISVTVWVGLRFGATFVAMHSLASGIAAVLFTLAGWGPFATIEDASSRALVAQAFVALVTLVGMALALSREERNRLMAETVASSVELKTLLTENKALLAQSESQRLLSERLLQAMSDMGEAVVIGEENHFVYVNRAFCDLSGYSQGELLALENPTELLANDEQHSEWKKRKAEIDSGNDAGRSELVLRTKTGRNLPIEFASKHLVDGDHVQRIHVIRDITIRRQWEDSLATQAEALLRTNDELKSLQAMRADFLAAISHDFRTPLTAIVAYVELLQDTDSAESIGSVSDFVGRIARGSKELNDRIETFLDFSRAERVGIELECAPASVGEIVGAVVESLRPALASHELVLDISFSATAKIEERALCRVVENLLTNAAKYSPEQSQIEVLVEERNDNILVSVADKGDGISANDIERVFESYYRAADVRGAVRGSGIGLSVARQFIEAMDGRIWAEQRNGGGTIFRFELPSCTADRAEASLSE